MDDTTELVLAVDARPVEDAESVMQQLGPAVEAVDAKLQVGDAASSLAGELVHT